jgi:D-hydroxyproline dehydrogenase subunit beta
MSPLHFDVVVVGTGIVGAACARELAKEGLRVAVCEANDHVGGGATAAGMGHIAMMDDSEAQFALTNLSQQLWRELSLELPREAEYQQCGSLWIAATDEEFAEVQRKFRFYTEREVRVEVLDPKQLSEAEPQLRKGMTGALLMHSDAVCYPPSVAAFLIDQVIASRGRLFLDHAVSALSDGELQTRQGERFAAGVIILACGAQAQKLVPNIEVNPRKGHLLITDRYPGFLRYPLLELGYLKSAHSSAADSVAFVVQPRATGQILVGSSRQYRIEDQAVDQRTLGRMLSRAVEYLPELQGLSAIRTWTGFRAATPDKLPLIGPCPGYESIYLATGHEGLGISTSLVTARLIADQIMGRNSEIARDPYLPLRSFAVHG